MKNAARDAYEMTTFTQTDSHMMCGGSERVVSTLVLETPARAVDGANEPCAFGAAEVPRGESKGLFKTASVGAVVLLVVINSIAITALSRAVADLARYPDAEEIRPVSESKTTRR